MIFFLLIWSMFTYNSLAHICAHSVKYIFVNEWICKSVWWWLRNSCLDLSFELQTHIYSCLFESSIQMSFKNFKLTFQIFPPQIFYRWVNGKFIFHLVIPKTLRSSLTFLLCSHWVFSVGMYISVTTLENPLAIFSS